MEERRTVRFDVLVRESGKPVQVTLWTKPEEDRDFMKDVRARRVVTVYQHNVGTKKDYGLVGFFPGKNAAFLIFPKAIKADAETKVVGIKYERVASESPKGPVIKAEKGGAPGIPMRERPAFVLDKSTGPGNSRYRVKPERREEPAREKFKALVRVEAVQEVSIEVEARSKAEASRLVKLRAAEVGIDVEKAAVKRSIKAVRKVS
jgi:hypothetical protein